MVRRYATPVEVVRRDEVPVQLRWRGRHYEVLHVLDAWRESTPWWEGAGVRILQTGESGAARPGGLTTTTLPPSPRWGQRAWGEPAPDVGVAVPAGLGLLADDREVWRLEVVPAAGIAMSTDPVAVDPQPGGPGRAFARAASRGTLVEVVHVPSEARWVLVRVHD